MVEIHDLHVRFHGASREAVAGIDLTIRDGEVVGLVGESGSGKTVTAMTLSGLIERKKVTLSGEVRFDGRDILRLPRAELRAIQGRELGVVFQEPMTAMDPLMRIGPQVEEALAVHTQLTKEQRRARALEALRDVDLPAPEEIYRKYPHECSGGQLQRVMSHCLPYQSHPEASADFLHLPESARWRSAPAWLPHTSFCVRVSLLHP